MYFENFKLVTRELLKGEALLLFANKESKFQSFEEFETQYQKFFWGSAKQNGIKMELLKRKYDIACG